MTYVIIPRREVAVSVALAIRYGPLPPTTTTTTPTKPQHQQYNSNYAHFLSMHVIQGMRQRQERDMIEQRDMMGFLACGVWNNIFFFISYHKCLSCYPSTALETEKSACCSVAASHVYTTS